MVLTKGVGVLDGVKSSSKDLELEVHGEVRLAKKMNASELDLYIKFRPSTGLTKRAEDLLSLLDMMGKSGKRPDGFYGVALRGPLRRLGRVRWTKTSPHENRRPPKRKPTKKAANTGAGVAPVISPT